MSAPRPYDLADPAERERLLRESAGYAFISRNDGTDHAGRRFALEGLNLAVERGFRLAPPEPLTPPPDPLVWYWTQDEETYRGACATREEAIDEAVGGLDPGSTFKVALAGPRALSPSIFRADRVLEEFEEHNQEAWGEDGPDAKHPPEAEAELEEMLAEALAAWLAKHRPYRARALDIVEESEELVTPGAEESEAEGGA